MIGQDKAAAHRGTDRVQSLKGCESGMEEKTSRGARHIHLHINGAHACPRFRDMHETQKKSTKPDVVSIIMWCFICVALATKHSSVYV
jgi:hypothetical protein